jgi:hypothetical protein
MTVLTNSYDRWHGPLTQGQRLMQDAAAALNPDLPSGHDTTTQTEPEGSAA